MVERYHTNIGAVNSKQPIKLRETLSVKWCIVFIILSVSGEGCDARSLLVIPYLTHTQSACLDEADSALIYKPLSVPAVKKTDCERVLLQ